MKTGKMESILVIDDDVELCNLVGEYLQAEGFTVECVHVTLLFVGAVLFAAPFPPSAHAAIVPRRCIDSSRHGEALVENGSA